MNTPQTALRVLRKLGQSCAVVAFAAILSPVSSAIFLENSAAYAQATARFSRVDVSGNQRIASDTVRAIAGITAGTRVTPGQINNAVQNLFDSGLFESVDVRPERGRLVIEVAEYPTINEISIEGNKRLKDEDLVGLVGSVPRRTYSPLQAERIRWRSQTPMLRRVVWLRALSQKSFADLTTVSIWYLKCAKAVLSK